ncbi:hypothetical protein LCGC14_2994130 [marine sediment metagenome]|uniref:Uncharacterized protein n=1 Tax=marine sediment metagenome TaxID=412755 RepID=A0A0F8XQK7_9ZZZZ
MKDKKCYECHEGTMRYRPMTRKDRDTLPNMSVITSPLERLSVGECDSCSETSVVVKMGKIKNEIGTNQDKS